MHAYLLAGENTAPKIDNIVKKLDGKKYYFPITKIEDVRQISDFLKHTQPENTVLVCEDVDKASTEALNAFLKNLEEPQKNIIFILTAKNEYNVIPTIVSRCQVVRLREKAPSDDHNASDLLDSEFGKQMLIVDKIKNRQEAIFFLQTIMSELHSKLTDNPEMISQKITATQKSLSSLEANGNVSLQLANLVVNLNAGLR